jgi:hypothetical protein
MSKRKGTLITLVTAWDTAWKAAAILRAFRNGQPKWIVPLLVTNSAGILPMLYLFVLSRRDEPASA